MALPLLDPLRDIVRTFLSDVGGRAKTAIVTAILGVVATGFLVSAGVVALTREIGFPLAALAFAAGFALLALAVHLYGRAASARREAGIRAARTRVENDVAFASQLASRSALPLLPLAAFLAAFVLTRRS